jgi:hypothetical protein
MNTDALRPLSADNATQAVEFFRLPAPGKRDPYFGLSRGWYDQAEAHGEIKMIAVRRRGTVRGIRLVVYDSVRDFIRRAAAPADVGASVLQ